MVKSFQLTNEFEVVGAANIPALVLFSERTTLWGPSSLYLSQAHENGLSPISPASLLRLLKDGNGLVAVKARRSWFNEDKRSKMVFPAAKWDDVYDSEMAELADSPDCPSVAPVQDDTGFEDAETLINAGGHEAFAREIQERLRQGQLPTAVEERARRLLALEGKPPHITVLRDILNHVSIAAREDSLPFYDFNWASLVALAESDGIELPQASSPAAREIRSEDDVNALHHVLLRALTQQTEDGFVGFLLSDDRRELVESLGPMPRCSELREYLADRLLELLPGGTEQFGQRLRRHFTSPVSVAGDLTQLVSIVAALLLPGSVGLTGVSEINQLHDSNPLISQR